MYLRFLLSGLIIKNILNTSTNSSREYATFDNLFLETQNDPGPWGSYWRVLIWCGFSSSCGPDSDWNLSAGKAVGPAGP